MFPFDIEEDEELEEDAEETYREYEVDYETGQLTGRIVEGLEAVKVWIYLALHTPRYYYQQYSWDYGHELEELIGSSSDIEYIKMEAERLVSECLEQNPHITDIEEFDARMEEEKLHMEFTVITEYGEVEIGV